MPKKIFLLSISISFKQGKNTDEAENWALKSSQNFFSKLQDNVTSAVKSKSSKRNKSASDQQESSAKRFKL